MASGPSFIFLIISPALDMGQDTTRYRGVSTAFSVLARIMVWALVWSCLDSTMKWKRTLMSPFRTHIFLPHFFFFSSTPTGFRGSKVHKTFTTRPSYRFGWIPRGRRPPIFFWFWFIFPRSHHFPFSSLPPCLDAFWKHCNFQEIPPLGTERHFGDGCRGSRALGAAHRARRIVV